MWIKAANYLLRISAEGQRPISMRMEEKRRYMKPKAWISTDFNNSLTDYWQQCQGPYL